MHSSLSFSEYEEKQAVPQRSINIEIPHASVRYEKQEPPPQRYAKTEDSRASQQQISLELSQNNQYQHRFSSLPNGTAFQPVAHANAFQWKAYHEPMIQDMPTVRTDAVAANATQSHFAANVAVSSDVKQVPPAINTTQRFERDVFTSPAHKDFAQPNAVKQTLIKTEQVGALQAGSVPSTSLQSYGATQSILQSEALGVASASVPTQSASENQDSDPPHLYSEKTLASAPEQTVAPPETEANFAASENKTPSFSPAVDYPVAQHESHDKSSPHNHDLPQSLALSDMKSVSTQKIVAEIQHEVSSSIKRETEASERVNIEREQQHGKQEPSNSAKITSVHDSFGGLSDSMAFDRMMFDSNGASRSEVSPLKSRQTADLTLSIVNSFDSSISNATMSSVTQLSQFQRETVADVIAKSEAGTKSDPNAQIMMLNSVECLDGLDASRSALSPGRDFGSSSMAEMSSSPGRTDEDPIKFFNASTDSFTYSVTGQEPNELVHDSPVARFPADASRLEYSAITMRSATGFSDLKAPSLLHERDVDQEAQKVEVTDAYPEPLVSEKSIEKSGDESVQGSERLAEAVAGAAEEKPVEEVLNMLVVCDFTHVRVLCCLTSFCLINGAKEGFSD